MFRFLVKIASFFFHLNLERNRFGFFYTLPATCWTSRGRKCLFAFPLRYMMPSFLSRIPDRVHSIPTFQLFILVDLHRTSPTQALERSACQFWKKEPLRGSKTSDLDLIGMQLTIHGGRRYHGCCCCCIIACATEVSYADCKKRYQVYEFRRILVSSRGLFLIFKALFTLFYFFPEKLQKKMRIQETGKLVGHVFFFS